MRARRSPPALAGVASLVALMLGAGAPARAERLTFTRYTTANGLPHNRINCIVQDAHQFIWFCTPEGLSRFDGHGFTTYTERDGLPNRSVTAFLEAADGDYWVGTTAGVCRFRAAASRCDPYPFPPGAALRHVFVLHRGRSGAIWAANAASLFRLDPGAATPQFERVSLGADPVLSRNIRALGEDWNGSLWIATPTGVLQRFPDGRVRGRFGADPARNGGNGVLVDEDGLVWVAHRTGLYLVRPSSTDADLVTREAATASTGPIDVPQAPGDVVRFAHDTGAQRVAIHRGAGGPLWIASGGIGLRRLEAGHLRTVPAPSDVAVFDPIALTTDRDGNLWVGTVADGAFTITRQAFRTFDDAEGLTSARIATIVEDRSGAIVVVAGDGAISRFDGARFHSVRLSIPGYPGARSSGGIAAQSASGDWWFSRPNRIFRFAVKRFEDLSRTKPTRHDAGDTLGRIRLFADSQGGIWLGALRDTAGVLLRWNGATETFDPVTLPQTRSGAPAAFGEDRAGNLWLGFAQGGLTRCRQGVCEAIDLGGMPRAPVAAFYRDDGGRLWFAAEGAGVGRIDQPDAAKPSIVAYGAEQGLSGASARTITGDAEGRVYIGSDNGIDRLDPATGTVRHFTAADGLAENEQHTAFRDRHGLVWFGTVRGLSTLVPRREEPGRAPPIRINRVQVAGSPLSLSALGETSIAAFDIEPQRNRLQIDFGSVGFAPSDGLRYQYRLSGLDREWSPPSPERSVTYPRLPPGTYTWAVQAITTGGLTSSRPATVAFRVLAPFWQQWWFVALATVTAIAAVSWVSRARVRRLIELEQVRTRIASDLHDDLGASLSQIAILGEVVRTRMGAAAAGDAAIAEPLARIGTLSRESVDSMSDIVWAIDPHKDRIESLAQRMRRLASELLPASGIDFTFDARDEGVALGADVRREVYLAFKETLNNAVRHSGCRRVDIALRTEGRSLVLEVGDDGRGFDPGRVAHGHGLSSLRSRAAAFGGSVHVTADAGTRITLRIPFRRPTHLNR